MTEYEKRYANFFYKFSNIIKQYKTEEYSKIIFLCIGTSKVIGDSFGPLVGKKLKDRISDNRIIILGDLKDNISALNIDERLNKITKENNNCLIISIDSALSRKKDIGKIYVNPYGMSIRKALGKNENKIGDLSIKAIVANDCKKSLYNYLELNKTPFSRIDWLSEITANGINSVIKNHNV